MLTFAFAVLFLIITPGPGVLSAAGVGSGYGFQAGRRYLAGLFVGTNLVALAVVSGLVAIVFSVPGLRTGLLYASAGYLIYLAGKIAFSGSKIAFITSEQAPGFRDGLLLQFINPKAYAVNTTFFSGFAFWPSSLVAETLTKFLIINAIWIPIHFLWLGAGVFLHRLDLPRRVQFVINIFMAAAMLAVVALAAFAQS